MNLINIIFVIIIAIVTAGCGSFETARHDGNDQSLITGMTATVEDISNIIDGVETKRPYSRYLYKVAGMEGQEEMSGVVSIMNGGDRNIRLIVTDGKLKVILSEIFRRSYDLEVEDSHFISFNGGYAAGGRFAIMPGIYMPTELYPKRFPSDINVSVDQNCNLLVRMKKRYPSEKQRLVAFMDAKSRLEDAKCKVLGTFDTIPQLKKLVSTLKNQGKYNDGQYYVLRLSWSSTFALVSIAWEKREE